MATKKRGHPARVGHTENPAPVVPKVGAERVGPAENPGPVVSHPAPAPPRAIPKVSADDRARSIQLRAYDLWERAGRPDGKGAREQFWLRAETEVMGDRVPPTQGLTTPG